ncbi:hypothetical protein PG984_003733 [Apiospora sp. TS-2023a]
MESCTKSRGASEVKTAPGGKKRALTQARREQNRAAQKLYRERQKKLREGLGSRQRGDLARPLYVELRPRKDSGSKISTSIAAAAASSPDEYDSGPSLFATDYTWEQQDYPSTSIASWSPVDTPLNSSSSNNHSNSIGPSVTSPSSLSPLYQGCPPSLYLADPYANARPLSQTAIFTALLHNALVLGFNLAALADCAHPYACLSPFYSATATAQDDPHRLVEEALARAAAAMTPTGKDETAIVPPPASLRPTLAQILVPHHASLDLIPFPQFRDRVILLSAALPHQFNLAELKTDIYVSGALRVATGEVDNGDSNSRTVGGRRRRSHQPWEPRSWEVSGWFLKKWSLAIDDGSREMVQEVA